MNIATMKAAVERGSPLVKRRMLDRIRASGEGAALDVVYGLIADENPFVAEAALDLACAFAPAHGVRTPRMLELLASFRGRPFLRKRCVAALGLSGDPAALPALAAALADPEESVRAEAVDALARFGAASRPALAGALVEEGAPWFAREAAAFALSLDGSGGDGDTFAGIARRLETSSDELRFSVARAFKEVGNDGWFRLLRDRFRLEPAEERAEIRRLLRSATDEARVRALLSALARMDEKRCHDLLATLGDDEATLERLVELEALIDGARTAEARIVILRVLGLSRMEMTVPAIARFLRDEDPRVRANAAEALADIGRDYVMEPLASLLPDPDASVRAVAAKALWRLGGAGALAPLSDMIKSPDRASRIHAARALGDIGVLQAVSLVLPALRDPDPEVRAAAARALGGCADRAAFDALAQSAADASEAFAVRRAALIALGRFGGPEAEELLSRTAADAEAPERLRSVARAVLAELGRSAAAEPAR